MDHTAGKRPTLFCGSENPTRDCPFGVAPYEGDVGMVLSAARTNEQLHEYGAREKSAASSKLSSDQRCNVAVTLTPLL